VKSPRRCWNRVARRFPRQDFDDGALWRPVIAGSRALRHARALDVELRYVAHNVLNNVADSVA
jgi:hypothetical protein